MSYTKHNFAVGDIIYAAPFNEMEDQIADNEAAVSELKLTGAVNIAVDKNNKVSSATGITYTWNEDKTICSITGTTLTDSSFANVFLNTSNFPYGLTSGDYLHVRFSTTDPRICYRIYFVPVNTHYDYYEDADVLIPEGATGGSVRLQINGSGLEINAQAKLDVYTAKTNRELTTNSLAIGTKKNKTSLKVLAIGNSYTGNAVCYAPYILDGLTETTDFDIRYLYHSGARATQYLDFFDNDTADAVVYYERNKNVVNFPWTGTNQTVKAALADQPWDIIIFQDRVDEDDPSDLITFMDKVLNYMHSIYPQKNIKTGYLMTHARYSPGYNGEYTYANLVERTQVYMNTSPIDFFIPVGTAIQNARGTSLNSLGEYTGLSADETGHLQRGLPCLITGYTVALKLLEIAGEPWHGILNEKTQPTDEWVLARFGEIIGSQRGNSVGVTYDNCYLGQKCAIAAIKSPTAISAISENPISIVEE